MIVSSALRISMCSGARELSSLIDHPHFREVRMRHSPIQGQAMCICSTCACIVCVWVYVCLHVFSTAYSIQVGLCAHGSSQCKHLYSVGACLQVCMHIHVYNQLLPPPPPTPLGISTVAELLLSAHAAISCHYVMTSTRKCLTNPR